MDSLLVAGALSARTDEIARRVHTEICAHIATYKQIPRAEIRATVGRIVEDVCSLIRSGAFLPPRG